MNTEGSGLPGAGQGLNGAAVSVPLAHLNRQTIHLLMPLNITVFNHIYLDHWQMFKMILSNLIDFNILKGLCVCT